jgi:ribonuclease-3
MSIIKPGKLGVGGAQRSSDPRKKAEARVREIWDDFSVADNSKASKNKREYQKGVGNRMILKPSLKPSRGDLQFKNDSELPGEYVEQEQGEPVHDYHDLEQRLEVEFKDQSLLARALTHRSALGIKERADYERLEFLGDAVLDLSVAHLLSDLHPDAREGELSKMRAALVNTQALAEIAKKLDLGPYIKLGRGELASGGAERPSILADVMEAVIGAVYRDSSYEVAMGMIQRIFGSSLEEVTPFDPKTELQESLHAAGSEPPSYLLELVEGPEHAPTFVTVVIVDGEIAGRGRGSTKKAAQQEAAAEALAKLLFDETELCIKEAQHVLIESALLIRAHPSNGASHEAHLEEAGEGLDTQQVEQ